MKSESNTYFLCTEPNIQSIYSYIPFVFDISTLFHDGVEDIDSKSKFWNKIDEIHNTEKSGHLSFKENDGNEFKGLDIKNKFYVVYNYELSYASKRKPKFYLIPKEYFK